MTSGHHGLSVSSRLKPVAVLEDKAQNRLSEPRRIETFILTLSADREALASSYENYGVARN
jgi:hypothetical protein